MPKRVKVANGKIGPRSAPEAPTRDFDQLAIDLLPAIQQAREMVDAMAINTPPPRRDLAWLSSVFSDYRIHLKTRFAELVAMDEEPSDLFPVYDKHINSLLNVFIALASNGIVDRKVLPTVRIFLKELQAETLLFN